MNDEIKSDVSKQELDAFLAPRRAGALVLGFVEEIHGEGGVAKPATITKHEAAILARHWLEAIAEIDMEWAVNRTSGSTNIRLKPYASFRLDNLIEAGLISEAEVHELANEVFAPVQEAEGQMQKKEQEQAK